MAPTHRGCALVSVTKHHHRQLLSGDHLHHGLLGAILSVRAPEGARGDTSYVKLLKEREADLWDAVLSGLGLYKKAEKTPTTLVLDVSKAIKTLKDENFSDTEVALIFSQTESQEVRHIGDVDTSLGTVTGDANLNGNFYGGGSFVAAGRAEVMLQGASMIRPLAGENRWTLAEWDASGICSETSNSIKAVSFSDTIFPLEVVDDAPGYTVKWDRDARTRIVDHNHFELLGTIARLSLDNLFPEDVLDICWSSRTSASLRKACKAN